MDNLTNEKETWSDGVVVLQTNAENMNIEEVLRKMRTERTLILKARKKQLKFLGYLIWKEGSENLALIWILKAGRADGGSEWPTWRVCVNGWQGGDKKRMVKRKAMLNFEKDRHLWRAIIDTSPGATWRIKGSLTEVNYEIQLQTPTL